MLTVMDVSRLAQALGSMQGTDIPDRGRYRYGGAGGEPMQQSGPDLGSIFARLLGFSNDDGGPLGFVGGDQAGPQPAMPTPSPTPNDWRESGYVLNGDGAGKRDVLRSLLGQLGG